LELSEITDTEHDQLQHAAKAIFFKDRTYRSLVGSAIQDPDRARTMLASLRQNKINLKLNDALMLIETVTGMPDRRFVAEFNWKFEATDFWNSVFSPS
jgi:hypothetical protein